MSGIMSGITSGISHAGQDEDSRLKTLIAGELLQKIDPSYHLPQPHHVRQFGLFYSQ